MKKLAESPLLIFAYLFTLTLSCRESEGNDPEGKIIAQFAGGIDSFEAMGTALFYDDKIMINGAHDIRDISIIVREQQGEGTYNVMGNYPNSPPKVEVNYDDMYSSSNFGEETLVGSVVLTEIDLVRKTISGRFNGRLVDYSGILREITSGSFTKIPYTTAPFAVLTCKIDGVDFTANTIDIATTDSVSADGETIRLVSIDGRADNSKAIHIAFNMHLSRTQEIYSFNNLNPGASLSCDLNSDNLPARTAGELMVFNTHPTLRFLYGPFYFDGENSATGKKVSVTQGQFWLMYIE